MADRALRAILDESNPNKAFSATNQARLGSLLDQVPRFIKGVVTAGILT